MKHIPWVTVQTCRQNYFQICTRRVKHYHVSCFPFVISQWVSIKGSPVFLWIYFRKLFCWDLWNRGAQKKKKKARTLEIGNHWELQQRLLLHRYMYCWHHLLLLLIKSHGVQSEKKKKSVTTALTEKIQHSKQLGLNRSHLATKHL